MRKQTAVLANVGVVVGVLLGLSSVSHAQDNTQESGINWQAGPGTGQLGSVAQIRIPDGYRFAGREGVRRFLELTQNPVGGTELGVLVPPEQSDNK